MGKKIGPINSLFVDCPVPYQGPEATKSGGFGEPLPGAPGPTSTVIGDPVQYMDLDMGDKVKIAPGE